MFELQISDTEKENNTSGSTITLLKKAIDSISDMVEDAELKITKKGITIQVMDSMHVCLVDIFLSKNIFSSYRCDVNRVLGIKVKNFNKIIKSIKIDKDGVFELHCEDDGNHLVICYESPAYSLSYKLKLYDFKMETYMFPEMDYPAVASIRFDDFMLLPKAVGTFDEFLHLGLDKDVITFKQGGEMGESSLILKANEDKGVVLNVTEPIYKEISMKYVNYMGKLNSLCDKVTISAGEEMPILFEFSLEDSGYLRFNIAAKMND